MIQRNGQSLLQLVNEMLDLAKIESGNLELQLQQGGVISFIKYLGESFQSMAEKKDIQLTIYSEVEALQMDFDAKKLSTILSNLLSNAIKFTPEGGKIIVHLNSTEKKEQAFLELKVQDTGTGISKKELPHIFDRFYQVDNSNSRNYEGTGIGLALTKELVELMQGNIEVKSQIGKGSVFIVQIPVTNKAVQSKEIQNVLVVPTTNMLTHESLNETPSLTHTTDLPLVLIIEDNIDVAHYLKTCLAEKYQVLHAKDGAIGIEMALEHIPDLIISDVMMPNKDGFEVCQTLKTDERTNHIPIIMLTAKVTIEDRLTGLAQGADVYLAKPFEKQELLLRLHNLLELRRTLQKKYSDDSLAVKTVEQPQPIEDPFIQKVRAIILADLENENFSLDDLTQQVFLSRSQVHRKIKAVTGMSTAVFMRHIRLQEAKKLLLSTDLSVSEVAYRVGFKTPVYFSQRFKAKFGESPSDVRKSLDEKN